MMPKLEFGQLYKFVVSLGFVLMVAALIGPWAILRDQGALLVNRQTLDELTPRAQQVLEIKQQHAEWIVKVYPWAALVLFIGGAVVAVWGLIHWWNRQQVADEREDVDLAVQRRTLDPLTPEEQERRLDTEAEEALATEAVTDVGREETEASRPTATAASATDDHEATPETSAGPTATAPGGVLPRPDWLAFREKVRGIEHLASARVAEALRDTHRLDTDVKVRVDGDVRGYADIVARAEPDSSAWSFVIDVKFTRSPSKNINPLLAESLVNGATVVRALGREKSAAVTIVVVETGGDDERARRALTRALHRIRDVSSVPVGALLIDESDLQTIPAAVLRRRLTHSVIGWPEDNYH